ncbi:MAG: YigZ family protein [Firmicutes bacterium]|nr:YigZ family protein [Bacillota bacterium]
MPIILPKPGTFELEEKKSRFIGYCKSVNNETEAKAVIAEIRAANPKAAHNVFAYSTLDDNIIRMSDDGEPSGSAGVPVLNVFQKTGVINYVCVVTRYWGGTLLGAGGLVRAYSKAAKGALDDAGPQEQITTKLYKVTCAYNRFDQVKYNFEKQEIPVLHTDFTTHCELTVEVTEFREAKFLESEIYTAEVLKISKHGVKTW